MEYLLQQLKTATERGDRHLVDAICQAIRKAQEIRREKPGGTVITGNRGGIK